MLRRLWTSNTLLVLLLPLVILCQSCGDGTGSTPDTFTAQNSATYPLHTVNGNCPDLYRELGNDGVAFEDVGLWNCWSCPKNYWRNGKYVWDSDACTKNSDWSKAAKAHYRGQFGKPDEYKQIECSKKPAITSGEPVTFYVATDLHAVWSEKDPYGLKSNVAINHLQKMQDFAKKPGNWPAGFSAAGEKIGKPAALVLTGDLTHYGHPYQLGFYRWLYEEQVVYSDHVSRRPINIPVFVGLGNHDVVNDCYNNECAEQMFDYVKHRMSGCSGVSNFDNGSHNYSWDWNKFHLVQLHTWAGDTKKGTQTHPSGLTWLEEDLKKHAKDGKPVILFQHYGFDDEQSQGTWNREAFGKIIDKYNVVAIFVGHSHKPRKGTFGKFDYLQGGSGGYDKQGSFFVVRLTDGSLDAVLVKWKGGKDGVKFDTSISLTKTIQ